jgi:hypothetical protein
MGIIQLGGPSSRELFILDPFVLSLGSYHCVILISTAMGLVSYCVKHTEYSQQLRGGSQLQQCSKAANNPIEACHITRQRSTPESITTQDRRFTLLEAHIQSHPDTYPEPRIRSHTLETMIRTMHRTYEPTSNQNHKMPAKHSLPHNWR